MSQPDRLLLLDPELQLELRIVLVALYLDKMVRRSAAGVGSTT